MKTILGSQYWQRLFGVGITIFVALFVGTALQLVFTNPFVLLGGTILISSAIIYLIDQVLSDIVYIISDIFVARKLKKAGFNSIEDATKHIKEYGEYLLKIQTLPPEAKAEVMDKVKRTEELIEDYKSRPEFYFENMGMTKNETIQQTKNDFSRWMKQRGYPVWPEKTPENTPKS